MLPTLSEDELARTLEMSPESIADLARTIAQHNPSSTIEPSHFRSDALGKQALEDLGQDRETRGIVGGLSFGATIGEGGMGIVRTAMQKSLGRKVAVKTLRPQIKTTDQATLRLLREAWVTGSLEHPNIVPVYDLGLGDDGTPIIVLKHIEGKPWSELLTDVDAMKELFGAEELLEQNLRILVQLCNAVSLAHSRGVIHRDLKPENVMIGRFGEVYLVDWGIAVSLIDDPTGRLPLASQSTEMAGTPSYMAPEMLGAMGKLSEQTDVYLLGAILYEILTGQPPHHGENFRQIVASILLSQFKYPESTPKELAEIASKAMSRAAEHRHGSAEELRQRLEWYLRHRGSLALSAAATKRVVEMREVLANESEALELDEVRDRVHHLFAEARFGFRQALRASGDNDVAQRGLREVTEIVVAFELDAGMPEAAAAALAELEQPPADLSKRVAAAMKVREEEKRRVAELERLNAQLDPLTGRRTRVAAALMLGLVWTIFPEICGWLYRRSAGFPYWWIYAASGGVVTVAVAIGIWGRESLTKTLVNRRIIALAMFVFATQLMLQLSGRLLGMSYAMLWVLHIYCWFIAVAVLTIFIDRRFWPSGTMFFAMFLLCMLMPQHVWHFMSVSNLVLLVNFVVAWSRPEEDGGFFMDRMRVRMEQRHRRWRRKPPASM